MFIILIAAFVVITVLVVLKFVKSYRIPKDRILLLSGTMGSGKTLFGVRSVFARRFSKSLKLFWKKIKYKIFHWKKKFIYDKPVIYSSIPLKSKYYHRLTVEMLLRQEPMQENCVIFIDEFGGILADQYSWNNPYVIEHLTAFIRFCRHWLDADIILTDQTAEAIAKPVRDRLSTEIHLSNFRKWFHFWCIVDVTPVEHITADTSNVIMPDDEHKKYMIMRMKKKQPYDTRCYHPTYRNGFVFRLEDDVVLKPLTTRYLYDLEPAKEVEKAYKEDRKNSRRKFLGAKLPDDSLAVRPRS